MPDETSSRCNADPAQGMIGQVASQGTVDRIVADSGAKAVRVIKPGMPVTMDFSYVRVNIDVDDKNVVVAIKCG